MTTTVELGTLTIRAATEQDYLEAARLFRSTMGESFTLDADLWKLVCTGDGHRAFVAQSEEGRTVALAVLIVADRIRLAAGTKRRRFHLDELIVDPDYRRQSIGTTLLEHIKTMAANESPSYIIVNCDFMNVAARKTYEAAGMHLVRQSSDRFEIAF